MKVMKKGSGILCSFLCLCILFTSAVFPASAAEVLPESPHPYKNKMDAELISYHYTEADADRVEALRVKFSSDSRTYDFNDTVFVFGANNYVAAELYGDLLSGAEVIVPGHDIYFEMTTDDSGTAYGYRVESIEPLYPVTYSFNANGGSSVQSITASLLTDPPVTRRSGKYFSGWYDNRLLQGDPITYPYRSDRNITLYAAWSSVPSTNIADFDYEVVSDGTVNIYKYNGHEKEIYIPQTADGIAVTHIDGLTFSESQVEIIHIGANITDIYYSAFTKCPTLQAIYVDEENPNYTSVDGVLYSKDMTTLLACPDAREGVFVIPDSVTTLNQDCFQDCLNLTGVTFNPQITAIPDFAFSGCKSLNGVVIPEKVATIGRNAFYGCSSLTEIHFHPNIKSFGDNCFLNSALYNDKSNWENGILYADSYLLTCKTQGLPENVVIKEGTTVVAYRAFYNNNVIKTVTLPESCIRLGEYAFFNCSTLEQIVLNDGLQRIESYALSKCPNLSSVEIPDSVGFIGNIGTFADDTSLETVVLGSGVTDIPANCFKNCTSLRSITLTASVKKISRNAFAGCGSLSEVIYRGTEEQWNAARAKINEGNENLTGAHISFVGPKHKKGDVNDDGKLNAVDKVLAKMIALGSWDYTNEEFEATDLNDDGKVNAVDLGLLTFLILGIPI